MGSDERNTPLNRLGHINPEYVPDFTEWQEDFDKLILRASTMAQLLRPHESFEMSAVNISIRMECASDFFALTLSTINKEYVSETMLHPTAYATSLHVVGLFVSCMIRDFLLEHEIRNGA